MPIMCSECGTPLVHINEACPNCLPGMADRSPTNGLSRLAKEHTKLYLEVQKLRTEVAKLKKEKELAE